MCAVTTYCHLVLQLELDYPTYRLVSDWLDDYYYTVPEERIGIVPELGAALMIWTESNLIEARRISYNCENFNCLDQKKIAQWILDYNS